MCKKIIYVRWLFDDVHQAVKALRQLSDSTVIQQGVGSADYEGWDLFEGDVKIGTKKKPDGGIPFSELTFVVYDTNGVNDEPGYWMTPYCFEGIKTYELDGTPAYGEAYDFSSQETTKEFEL